MSATLDALAQATAAATADQATIAQLKAQVDALTPKPPDPRPSVASWSYSPASTGVSVSATFSKDINPATLSAKDATAVSQTNETKTYPAQGYTFDASKRLAVFQFGVLPSGSYRVTMPATAVTDQAGQSMESAAASGVFAVLPTPDVPAPSGDGLPANLPATLPYRPSRPAQPNMPATSTTHNVTANTPFSGTNDFKGETFIQQKGVDWSALFATAAASTVLQRARAKTVSKDMNGVHAGHANCTVNDFDFLDDSGWAFMVRGDNFTSNRTRVRTLKKYAYFIENKTGSSINDFTCEDPGADGIFGTKDDPSDAGSEDESVIRYGGCSGKKATLRKIWIRYASKTRKACIRGDVDLDAEDGYCEGAQTGINALNEGDGGRGWMVDRANTSRGYATPVNNPDETRKAVMAAKNAGGDLAKCNAVFMATGRVDVDVKDKSKGEQSIGKIMDANSVAQSMAERKTALAQHASANWRKWVFNFGYAVEYGSTITMDDKCAIIGTDAAGGYAIQARLGEYPEIDWRLPGDQLRPEGRIRLNGTRLYAKNGICNTDEATMRRFISGRFYFNDKLMDWS